MGTSSIKKKPKNNEDGDKEEEKEAIASLNAKLKRFTNVAVAAFLSV